MTPNPGHFPCGSTSISTATAHGSHHSGGHDHEPAAMLSALISHHHHHQQQSNNNNNNNNNSATTISNSIPSSTADSTRLTEEQVAQLAQDLTPLLTSHIGNVANTSTFPGYHNHNAMMDQAVAAIFSDSSPVTSVFTPHTNTMAFATIANASSGGSDNKDMLSLSPLTSPALLPQSRSTSHQLNPAANSGGRQSLGGACWLSRASNYSSSLTHFGSEFAKPAESPASCRSSANPQLSSIDDVHPSTSFEAVTTPILPTSSGGISNTGNNTQNLMQQTLAFLSSSGHLNPQDPSPLIAAAVGSISVPVQPSTVAEAEEFSLDLLSSSLRPANNDCSSRSRQSAETSLVFPSPPLNSQQQQHQIQSTTKVAAVPSNVMEINGRGDGNAHVVTPASLLNLPVSAHELPLNSIQSHPSHQHGNIPLPSLSRQTNSFNFDILSPAASSAATKAPVSVHSEPPGKYAAEVNSPPPPLSLDKAILDFSTAAGKAPSATSNPTNRKRERRKSAIISGSTPAKRASTFTAASANSGRGGRRPRRISTKAPLSPPNPLPIRPSIAKTPTTALQPTSPEGSTRAIPTAPASTSVTTYSSPMIATASSSVDLAKTTPNGLKPITPRGLKPKPSPTSRPTTAGSDSKVSNDDDPIARLSTKSNYQNILEGKSDELGLKYSFDLFSGLEQRRTSHKQAEQKRRDCLKSCFEALKSKLPDLNPKMISKIYLLNQALSYIDKLEADNQTLREEYRQLKGGISKNNDVANARTKSIQNGGDTKRRNGQAEPSKLNPSPVDNKNHSNGIDLTEDSSNIKDP